MKYARRLIGMIAATLLSAYFIWFCWHNLDLQLLKSSISNAGTLSALLVASLCYMMIYPISGAAWRRLLLRQGHSCSSARLTTVLGVTQLAKYIPGNIAQHVCRTAYALRQGIPIRTYVSSVVQETFLAASASILVGTTLLASTAWQSNIVNYKALVIGALATSCVGILIFCIDLPVKDTPYSNKWLDKLINLTGGLPGTSTTLTALLAYCSNYLLIGLGIWLIASALGLSNVIDYGVATSAFAIAWILGFLAPGAPAGLGAREGVMLLVLKGHGTDDQTIQLVLLARASSMLGDLAAFIITFVLSTILNRSDLDPHEK